MTSSRRRCTRSVGLLVLRRALRDHRDDRGVARLVDLRVGRRTRRPFSPRSRSAKASIVGLRGRVRQLGGDHQRAVRAGPEALGVEVVGLAGHRARRVVAGVREAEPHAERGRGQREQHGRGGDRGGPGPALHGVAPARGRRLAAALDLRGAAEQREPPAVDPRAEVGQQRGQQRDGREHHDEHRERGRDRDAVHVRQAGQHQAEHGDHHGGAGEDHAPPRGGHRLDHRVVPVLAVGQRGAEPGQDEQRVVDADADPDQARHRRRPVGDVDDVGEQHDQAAGGDAEAEQGDHERQAGRDHRAERDQQHDRGAEEARGPRGWSSPARRRSGRRPA